MSNHMMRALGEMSKHGGNYFGQIHVEGLRQKRLQDAKVEAEKIYQRNRVDKLEDTAAIRVYQEGREEDKREQGNEDARTRVDYQIEQQDAASARRSSAAHDEKAQENDLQTFYDAGGNPQTFKVNAYGEMVPAEELKGLSKDNPRGKAYKETDSQRRNNGYLVRMSDSSHQMFKIAEETGLDVAEMNQQLSQYADINLIKEPALRQYATNMSDWVRSKLRKESGAVIGEQEAIDEIKTYFPWPGDTKGDIDEKRRKRSVAEFSLFTEVKGTKATKKEFVSAYGDPFGLFDTKGARGTRSSKAPDDIQSILDDPKNR
jgi:hypothetical protein